MGDGEPEEPAADETLETMLRERRGFLAGLAATAGGLVAGCTGDSEEATPAGTDAPTDAPTEETTPTGTEPAPTDEGTPTATATPEAVDPPMPDPAAYEASPALHPSDAPESFTLPQGLEIELVASEPLIRRPVDVEWDARGRMWVVEMPDYMSYAPGDGEGDRAPGSWGDWGGATNDQAAEAGWGDAGPGQDPSGRVVVLEDVDGDGQMEDATVFLDDLTLPRSIAFVGYGVLIGLPGELLYCQYDEDSLEIMRKESVSDDYATSGGPNDNPEHTDNGLLYGLDNWLYSAKSDTRLRLADAGVETENTQFRGQWGITQDDAGRLYYTTNSNWLFADLVPSEYDPGEGIGEIPGDASDPSVYTVRENYGTNRAYRGGYHRDDGRMKTISGVAGPGAYRGDLLPFEDAVFSPDSSGNVVAQFDVSESTAELDVDATHRLYDDDEWGQREFLGSTNEVFRPVNVKTGPDGALYVVDMYKGIFQHVRFLSDYLAEYIIENDLHKVPPAGRIWRIVPEGEDVDFPDVLPLDTDSPADLAQALEHENGYVRKLAQQRLVERGLTDATGAVRDVAQTSGRPMPRVHALWTLHGMGELDLESVAAAIDTGHSRVQQAAIRTGEVFFGTGDAPEFVDTVLDLATDAEQDPRVVAQAGYSLSGVGSPNLENQVEEARSDIEDAHAGNRFVDDAFGF